MSSDQYEGLEGLAKAATPGPWMTCVRMGGDAIVDAPSRPIARVDYRRDQASRDRDAAYIAAANPQTILKLIAENRAYREALEPFAEFGSNVDDQGWTSNIHREGISVWFGPSDFRKARSALTQGAAHPEQQGGQSHG